MRQGERKEGNRKKWRQEIDGRKGETNRLERREEKTRKKSKKEKR